LITYQDWIFAVYATTENRHYLQITAPGGICNLTGISLPWKGRKWYLSPHMTKSEFVQTALKAVLTALEHEARECFLYKGWPVFDPHYDVDKLLALRSQPDALSE
jgi:hypothetical protein